MRDYTYEKATQHADALSALGETEIYLHKEPFPWHLAVSCEPGGSHRLEICTRVWFRADDSGSGLSFRWAFDIEPRSANGTAGYHIDTKGCRRVLSLLPLEAKVQFQEYLSNCAAKVRDKGHEWRQAAEKGIATAAQLESLTETGQQNPY